MKFDSLFLLIISLATVSSLVDIYPASAQMTTPRPSCINSRSCRPVIRRTGVVRGSGTIPSPLVQQLNDLIAQENFPEAEKLLVQFLGQAERTQDLSGQAAAHEALGDVYTRMNRSDLASSHLKNAGALYQRLGNVQGSSEVQRQIQQMQLRQIQLQQR